MARRGRKRQLEMETEYWRLLASGVGTVSASTSPRVGSGQNSQTARGQIPGSSDSARPPQLRRRWQHGWRRSGGGLTWMRTISRSTSRVHSGVIVDQWDALVDELAATPDVVDRLLVEHVPDELERC